MTCLTCLTAISLLEKCVAFKKASMGELHSSTFNSVLSLAKLCKTAKQYVHIVLCVYVNILPTLFIHMYNT